jgi:DNA polymerase-3 subunit delta
MGVLTVDTLLRSVKKAAPDPAYYLYGDEDVLKDEAVRALGEATLDPAARDFNLDQRAAGELDVETLHALLNTPPMMAARRLVVLREVEGLRRRPKTRDELLRYLERPSPSTVLVLVQGAGEEAAADLADRTTAVEIPRLPPERVLRWMGYHATRLGIALEPDAAAHLQRVVGDDLGILGRELEKLAALGVDGPVGRDQVAALVGVRHGETVDDLVAAVLDRDAPRGAGLVAPVLEQPGVTGVRLVSALGAELVGTALARAESDGGAPRGTLSGRLIDHLKRARPRLQRPWRQAVGQWIHWAEGWTAPELAAALRRALETDAALKRGTVSDERGLVLELVLALGVRAQEAA